MAVPPPLNHKIYTGVLSTKRSI